MDAIMDLLLEWVAAGAFYDAEDALECHPQTRMNVLNKIMQCVCEYESKRDDFMPWFFGPASAGKTSDVPAWLSWSLACMFTKQGRTR
jgi:hypothetical protein